ncbi:cobalamin B12-binding domain-containing protein [Ornithinimicrobium flavum]|uniref:cobalamin B12-binding domain-containing protein n=1 Tax=Ornithinimicrobium flavum TaxID=1288636 RepID=UPI001070555E|nr:B12-binding domain-containing protein [Ornithinimicrobium flavum]
MHAPPLARTRLFRALLDFDEARAWQLLEQHREHAGLSSLVGDLVLPVMREIGAGWECGEVTVAQEHLATQMVRSYLDSLRRPPATSGPQAWLACPPRELHDLPLLALGLLLWDQGWQIRFFGANTPLHDLLRAVRVSRPELVVVSGDDPRRMRASAVPLDLIAAETTLVLGGRAGAAAGPELAGRVLPPDVVLAAEELRGVLTRARALAG